LDSAVRAFGSGHGEWPRMTVAERIRHVADFAVRMKAKRDEVVRLMMWEIAKPLADCYKEFDRTVDYIRDTIDALKELDRTGSRFSLQEGFAAQIRRSPLGVVLCMGPFNYPLNETFTTLIPALIMGNTVVFKTPKFGVLLFAPLLDAFAECFPPGVINTVFGEGSKIVGPMMASGNIDVLAFIGSARVANILKHQHPRMNRLRCVLGLDAKNPAVVLEDADLDLAARECLSGSLSFNGQRCTAVKVIFVHRRVADAFCEKFARAVEDLSVGLPWEQGVQITPLAEDGKTEFMKKLVDDAVQAGAKVINAGGAVADRTVFFPAVLYPVSRGVDLARVEQFEPVVPIVPYDSLDEVFSWIEESPYGQQAAIFGKDPGRLGALVDSLVNLVCRVNLNSQCQRGPDVYPFSGRKDSAEGTLSVSDALRVFSIRSLVVAKGTPENQEILSRIVTERHSKFLSTDFLF
jgi:glyceraldehyde-3-phosphate dehydrogenase (NADP+)